MSTRRGIYLVANLKSQPFCENLIYSIRQSGCELPIRLIHYGGKPVNSAYILREATLMYPTDFPVEGLRFVERLRTVLTDCPRGFLNRFLAWFGDWAEFIYSDNDIVALMNWEKLLDRLPGYQLVHADEEYVTKGRFNYEEPQSIQTLFGHKALESAFTAGHFASTNESRIVEDINQAIDWFKKYPYVPKKHDQALLHVASLLGNWTILNLCKPPHNWLTTWANDYPNVLSIIQAVQTKRPISHLHFSGQQPDGTRAIDDLLFSSLPQTARLNQLMLSGFQHIFYFNYLRFQQNRVKRALNRLFL